MSRSRRWLSALLTVSFVPLAVSATSYVGLGSYVPITVLIVMATLVLLGLRRGDGTETRTIKLWAACLVAWGLIRLVLYVVFGQLNEAHLISQRTTWYLLLSIIHLAMGLGLFQVIRMIASEATLKSPYDNQT